MNKCTERVYNGLIKENPTFVLMLGMCPTLAVTTSAINGLGMGLSTTVVLVLSNMLISMLRKVIPRITCSPDAEISLTLDILDQLICILIMIRKWEFTLLWNISSESKDILNSCCL